MSNPGLADIFGAGFPYAGIGAGPVTSNFGLSDPNVPMVSWAPQGNTGDMQGPASFLDYGKAPTSHGHISLKSFDFIQYTYLCPPFGDANETLIMPDMLVFTVNEMDSEEGSTNVFTLPKVNQLAHDAYKDFLDFTRENDSNYFQEAADFKGYMTRYGEKGLETYHRAQFNKAQGDTVLMKDLEDAGVANDLKRYYELATNDVYCWLTRFGILSRISFAGSVINVNRGTSLEEIDMTRYTEHYTQVNVCLAKRGRVANVFGSADRITTGSKLWIILRRKRVLTTSGTRYDEFQFVPGGDTLEDYPSQGDLSYVDDSGRACVGHVWRVGVVITPGNFSPQPISRDTAANLGVNCSERQAYEAHGTLPVLYVALGFKN